MLEEPILIGLAGKKRSGKNTVGKCILEWAQAYGHKAELRGFADLMKLSLARIFVPDATLEEALDFFDVFKQNGKIKVSCYPLPHHIHHRFGWLELNGREVGQQYGTEAHRDIFGENFWVDALLPINDDGSWDRNDKGFSSDTDVCIVTDVRRDNEAERVINLGGRIWEVRRSEIIGDDDHISERGISSDYIQDYIYNIDPLDVLKKVVGAEMDNVFNLERDLSGTQSSP